MFTYSKYGHVNVSDGKIQFNVLSTLFIYSTYVRLVRRAAIIYEVYILFYEIWVIFHLKSVNFLFCSVYLRRQSLNFIGAGGVAFPLDNE